MSVDELSRAIGKLVVEETKREINQIKKLLITKTPIAILQELLSRCGIVASYELVQTETVAHETIFRYRVAFKIASNTFMTIGNGRTKKEAKHYAARVLLDQLKYIKLPAPRFSFKPSNNSSDEVVVSKTVPPTVKKKPSLELPSNDDDLNVSGNPVGWIQELCMQKNWQPPDYTTVSEEGLANERIYKISCCLLNFREIGKGRSKRIAKRWAANKMKACLLDNKYDKNQRKICLMTSGLDYKKMLSEIAEENKFYVSYVDIEERAFSGKYQCMIHISTLPVGVCPGSGESKEDAQNAAAGRGLEFLKIMSKK